MADKKKHKSEKEDDQQEKKIDDAAQSETQASEKEEETKSEDAQSEEKTAEPDRTEELEKALAAKTDQYLRLQAEFDNYRKRTLKEKMELTKSAGESILLNILPLIDDFERGLAAMEKSNEVESVKQGVSLIYKRFNDFVGQNGVKEIEAKNCNFDTDLHEAITKIPAPSEDMKGKVVDVIQKGYTLNDKVIRFAKVVVGE